jgi:hypothetical protein
MKAQLVCLWLHVVLRTHAICSASRPPAHLKMSRAATVQGKLTPGKSLLVQFNELRHKAVMAALKSRSRNGGQPYGQPLAQHPAMASRGVRPTYVPAPTDPEVLRQQEAERHAREERDAQAKLAAERDAQIKREAREREERERERMREEKARLKAAREAEKQRAKEERERERARKAAEREAERVRKAQEREAQVRSCHGAS